MHGSEPVAWALTLGFALLVLPCAHRLAKLDHRDSARTGDLAELLMTVAMVAMVSPVGGPIPVAGWQAVLGLAACWFALVWWRGRRDAEVRACHGGHHAVTAAVMCYMVTAMPHTGHGSGPPGSLALPAVAIAAGAYFAVDAAWSAVRAVHERPVSRTACRGLMGAGMAYLLFVSL
ncbi:DUF5134 domain-containing protein [Amycolatopsis minnesotensis]|uniref:DUF5134 domain-containing protein n=1 Tax=Amycolatopsis minnesotensis TaxID=337894 RepID=A0ABN2RAW4_9PSEU